MSRPARILVSLLGVVLATGAMASAAASHQTYMVCDNGRSPDYPSVLAHPKTCDLGLSESIYQAQPYHLKPFGALGLRDVRWLRWGTHEATGHGLSCDVRSNGLIYRDTCDHAVVNVASAQSVGPAGFAFIYQVVHVRHRWSHAEPYSYDYWFQPGTDY